MKEDRNHHEDNNSGMIIAAIIAIILVVGLIAYFVMGNNDVEDAIDDVKDTTENIIDNDNDTKTMSDIKGSYQAKIDNSSGIDQDTAADEDDYIEIVLEENGKASLVITSNNKNTITGNYTISDNMVIINTTSETLDENNTNNNQSYEFTINDDNTLSYLNGNDTVILSKVENNTLKYIK